MPVHSDLGSAVAVAGAEPAVMGAAPVDLGREPLLDRPHAKKSRVTVQAAEGFNVGVAAQEARNYGGCVGLTRSRKLRDDCGDHTG
jgi:hypothetical protein